MKLRRAGRTLLLVVLAGWGAWVWLWPPVSSLFVRTENLGQDVLRHTVTLEGVLVRDESVVRAPVGGAFRPLLADGARVNRDGLVGRLVDSQAVHDIRSPRGGIVYYWVDGLEGVLVPEAATGLFALPASTVIRTGEAVARGEPLFRVVDNLSPVYAQFALPEGLVPREMVAPGQCWGVLWGETVYAGRVSDLLPGEGQTLLRLRFEQYPEEFLEPRRLEFAVITREQRGYVVSRQMIRLRGGRPGVVVRFKDGFRWQPVTVEGQVGRQVLVSGPGLTAGTRVVTNPWLIHERRLR